MTFNKEPYDIDGLRGLTPATIRAAFNNSDEIMEEHGDMGSVNATGIMTVIMHDVGRLNEHWATDALYGLDKIRALSDRPFRLDTGYGETFDEIITFGIRECGVDHAAYVMSRMMDTRRMPAGYVFPKHDFRKIYAVRMRAFPDPAVNRIKVEFSLREIINALHDIDPADLAADGFHLAQLPNGDKISPEPTDEKFRIDKVEIAKARAGGYVKFGSYAVHPDVLESEGCAAGVRCIEIGGIHPPIVPAPKNPHDNAVCRVYALDRKPLAVVWIDRWYEHYGDVKAEIEKARKALAG